MNKHLFQMLAGITIAAGISTLLAVGGRQCVAAGADAPAASTAAPARRPLYMDPAGNVEDRVNALFGQLTQDEKLKLLGGTGFTTQPIPRLGIPPMGMVDAGQGVRGGTGGTQGPATLFPAEIDMARTWDPGLVTRIGTAIGEEVKNKGEGAQVLLGPCVNIHRSPLGGRDAESFSEDPYLAAQLATAYIQGVQSTGVAACIKHFACNNEEQDRMTVDVHVDDRTLNEIYLPAFKAGVQQGHARAVMAAYNRVNGYYATANRKLLHDILKRDWHFDGLLMSDWGAVHETVWPINAGCDLEMPVGDFFTVDKLKTALANHAISQDSVDSAVKDILRTIVRVGLLDGPMHPDGSKVNSAEHKQVALDAAGEAIILLKNDTGVLPLNPKTLHSIAIIGPGADSLQAGALGSPSVTPLHVVTPIEALKAELPASVTINHALGLGLPSPSADDIPSSALTPSGANGQGLSGEYFTSPDCTGLPVATRLDPTVELWDSNRPPSTPAPIRSALWTGTLTPDQSGVYVLQISTQSLCRLFVSPSKPGAPPSLADPVINYSTSDGSWDHRATVQLEAGKHYDVRLEVYNRGDRLQVGLDWVHPEVNQIQAAVAAAAKSDAAVVFVTNNNTEGEGYDRSTMALPGSQAQLIEAVAKANRNTIVVINAGSPVLMHPWLDVTPAVVDAGIPGQEGGTAIANVLLGTTNPSGKLTDTIGATREDYPDFKNFPGKHGIVNYAEGIYVGYRYFDKRKIAPVFPFGYGLSYTNFSYTNLRLSSPSISPRDTLAVTLDVTNSGSRSGDEVVEVYVRSGPDSTVDRPVRQLRGFQRINLNPRETKTITFQLTPADLAYYDVTGVQWRSDPGQYSVDVGASSRDIRLSGDFKLTDRWHAED